MKSISSVQNEEIKSVAQLADSKERKCQQRFIVEGIRAITTFIEAGHRPLQLYVTYEKSSEAQNLVDDSVITTVTHPVLKRISQATTPSGLLAVFGIPQQSSLQLEPGLVLARIADPGNMGTLIRTSVALGRKTVVVIEGADVWSPKVIQASAGTIAKADVITCSWQEVIRLKQSLTLVGLVVQGGEGPSTHNLTDALLVVGNEASGIPEEWLADCDSLLTLPMPGGTESLNAAVAGSIALYAAWQTSNH